MEIFIFYILSFIVLIVLIQLLPILIPLFIVLYLVFLFLGYRRRTQVQSFHKESTASSTRAPKNDAIDVDYTEREDKEQ